MSVKKQVDSLIDAGCTIKQYMQTQNERMDRLKVWKANGVSILIKNEARLIAMGEKILAEWAKRKLKSMQKIDAIQWSGKMDQWKEVYDFCPILTGPHPLGDNDTTGLLKCSIEKTEGTLFVNPGDYIIKDVKGDFYTCDAETFGKTSNF